MRFVSNSGIMLHYTVEGAEESQPLVFINSLGCDLRIWDDVIPEFSDDFLIVRYDKRGHGLSDCPPPPYTIQDHTSDLAALVESLNLQNAIVIGISVGGMVALAYTAQNPGRVKALALSDTGTQIGTAERWNERIEALRANGMESLAETILGIWFAPDFIQGRPNDYRGYYNMLTRMPVAGYTGTCEAIRDADLSEAARHIDVPTLVLCGSEDVATPPEQGRELSETLKQARFEQIDQAGHLPCVEQPKQMADALLRFFQENGYV